MTTQQDNSIQKIYPSAKANIKKTKRISPFWLLPFIALCIGAVLFFQIIQEQGTSIKITFQNGNGLIAGKTQIRYQGLQIGVVKKVNFTQDLKFVEVSANIYPEAKKLLRENTKFWIVKPTASLAGISGIDALVSGNYITLQPGDGSYEDEFVAQTEGPITQVNDGDLLIHLVSDDLGSISIGASVYFKKLPVGKISSYRFINNGQKVEIDLLIDKTYAQFVKKESYFWNISGLNANVGINGININLDSLNALVQGAVAFDSPDNSEHAQSGDKFTLFANYQAAQRGAEIRLALPKTINLQEGQAELYYKNRSIGVLSRVISKEESSHNEGILLVDPNLIHLFNTHSHIVLRNKNLNLRNLSNISNLLKGEYLELISGNGEAKKDFTLLKENELLLQQPNTLVLYLKAPKTYGINEGQGIYYNDVYIGQVIEQHLDIEGVTFKIGIAEKYKHLIRQDTQFIADSNLDVKLDTNGLEINVNAPDKWLRGGIRVITGKKNAPHTHETYPLFKDLYHAEAGITNDELRPTLTLTSKTHPNLDKNALVLYQGYEVGKVLSLRPTSKQFEIDVYIYPKHQHLLADTSQFWIESAAKIDISTKGISIEAQPFNKILRGAISFDKTDTPRNNILYESELKAKSTGKQLTLITDNAKNLSKGTALRYLGLDVGEIDEIQLNKNNQEIIIKALIHLDYMKLIAKEGSEFKLITPQLGITGVENLDSVLQPYIEVVPGNGKLKNQFRLQKSTTSIDYSTGLALVLETTDASNITQGAPVLYRGIEVGLITKRELNKLGDRVFVHIVIERKYQHLVRKNTEFWISSGYDVNIGLSGAEIRTGSMEQLLKGGISFSTPESKIIEAPAKAGQHFLLQSKKPTQAEKWGSGALQ
ncbi:MCE family protein [[Haemophilus] felis]|uniref:Mce/MlaD domain-containing protein n=1 Tax=[Haemophilus] felis TaxID=123822 RepID=A0A1T0AWP6_9PAST|nr:MCE family protein [[Haemophilus] felis]NBI40469.1 MCE family protein [[Haemophilus] felis]OOS02112.1 hypothetical protein B0188_09110 [[Haemophilus] felis]